MVIKRLAIFLIMLSFSLTSFALKVSDLYVANVPVTSGSNTLTNAVLLSGYQQILVKLTGSEDVVGNPQLKIGASQIRNMVQRYSYLNKTLADSSSQQYMQIYFQPSSINQLLTSANQAIWGSDRPVTLVWLAIDQGNQAKKLLLGRDSLSSAYTGFDQLSSVRGVPILWPTMDLKDMNQVSTDSIWQMDLPTIIKASSRYQVNQILVGRVYQTHADQKWHGQWMLLVGNRHTSLTTTGKTMEGATNDVISQLANLLSSRYAVGSGSDVSAQINIHITGISGLSDYSDVVNYLKSLNAVTQVNVNNINANSIDVTLDVAGGVDGLNRAVGVDNRLMLVSSPAQTSNATNTDSTANTGTDGDAAPAPVSVYRWQASTTNTSTGQAGQP